MGIIKKNMENNKTKRGGNKSGSRGGSRGGNSNQTVEPRKSVDVVDISKEETNSLNNSLNQGSAKSSGKKFNPKELNLPNLDGSFDIGSESGKKSLNTSSRKDSNASEKKDEKINNVKEDLERIKVQQEKDDAEKLRIQ